MEELIPILIPAALGALLGAAFVLFARFSARWPQLGARRVLAFGLIAAAAVYVGLAFASDNLKAWLGIEMTGLAVYGSFALLGVVGSPWWLAAGYALHPFWHLQFHYIGTGSAFTPEWLTLGLTGFDAAVAAYLVFACLRGLHPTPRRGALPAPEAKLTRNERRLAKKSR